MTADKGGRNVAAGPGRSDERPMTSSIQATVRECSLGAILIAVSEKGVCAILIGDNPEALARELLNHFPEARVTSGDKELDRVADRVIDLVETPARGADLPLDIRGTNFQRSVWQALREIPTGTTASYRDIANRIGAPKSARAVARACASNRLAVAIPCHRVVRSDGGLSGYRWGVDRKRRLLEREAA